MNTIINMIQQEYLPDLDYFRDRNNYAVKGAFIKPLEEMLELHEYKSIDKCEVEAHNVTIYEPVSLRKKIVIYVPGFGRNFTLFHLNRMFETHGISLVGVDLYGYGYTYYHNRPPRYNGYHQDKFDANLSYILQKYQKYEITLVGNSTGGCILTHYLNQNPHVCVRKVVLTSPAIPADTKKRLPPIPFLEEALKWGAEHVPDLIMSHDANPDEFPFINAPLTISDFESNPDMEPWANWLHVALQQYNRSDPEMVACYDPLYSPLRNKSITISQIYQITKTTPIEFDIPTVLVFADNPLFDKNIDIDSYKDRKWASNVKTVYMKHGFHEMLLSDKETVKEIVHVICA